MAEPTLGMAEPNQPTLPEIATLTAQLYNAHCDLWNEVPIAYNDIGSDASNDICETWALKSASLLLSFLSLEDATIAYRDHYKRHGATSDTWQIFVDTVATIKADRQLAKELEDE
jgi:hypothetical protein